MIRRNLLLSLAGVVFTPTRAVRAQQQAAKPVRIGILSPAPQSSTKLFDAFRARLRELGYIEGKNITIEYRLSAGDMGRLPGMAADLVRLPVDIIVTDGGEGVTQIARAATSEIPIVMATAAGDLVGAGLATSFAAPGGNTTGFTLYTPELSAKRLQLLKEVSPQIERVAVLWDPASRRPALSSTEAAAVSLAIQLSIVEIATPGEIGIRFATAIDTGAEAFVILPGAMFWNERARIIALVAGSRLPAVYPEREYAEDGGLFAYGPDVAENFRRAATYVDKIVRGAKPGELPIEQPTRFELVVNLKTAKELRLTIPPMIVGLADQVIE
jgi:putative ABC transport system substrate-binding protein